MGATARAKESASTRIRAQVLNSASEDDAALGRRLIERAEPGQPFDDISLPADTLAELTVTNDVNADIDLPGDNVRNGPVQQRQVLALIHATLHTVSQQRREVVGPHQATDMRYKDSMFVSHLVTSSTDRELPDSCCGQGTALSYHKRERALPTIRQSGTAIKIN